MIPNRAAPRQTPMWVRRPAGWWETSRSRPITPPSPSATSTRSVMSRLERATFTASSSGSLERRPGQEQLLLPHAREPHRGFRLVALPGDVDDDPFSPLAVHHVVAHPQAQPLAPAAPDRRRAGGRRAHGPLDDAVPALRAAPRPGAPA